MKLSLRIIILIAGIIGFIALIPIYFVKEPIIHKEITRFKKSLQKELKNFIIITGIFSLAKFSDMFLIYYTSDFYTSFYFPVLFYVLFNIFYAIGVTPLGILSDKIGRAKIIGIGYLLFIFICLFFAFLQKSFIFFILFPLYGIFYACVNGNQRAYVSDLAKNKGTALGLFHTVNSISVICANIIVGLLWKIKPMVAFLYSAAISTIATLLLLRMFIVKKGLTK